MQSCMKLSICVMFTVMLSLMKIPSSVSFHLSTLDCFMMMSWYGRDFWITTQIAKTLGSMLIRYRSDTEVSDRRLIDIDPRVIALWAALWERNPFVAIRFPSQRDSNDATATKGEISVHPKNISNCHAEFILGHKSVTAFSILSLHCDGTKLRNHYS